MSLKGRFTKPENFSTYPSPSSNDPGVRVQVQGRTCRTVHPLSSSPFLLFLFFLSLPFFPVWVSRKGRRSGLYGQWVGVGVFSGVQCGSGPVTCLLLVGGGGPSGGPSFVSSSLPSDHPPSFPPSVRPPSSSLPPLSLPASSLRTCFFAPRPRPFPTSLLRRSPSSGLRGPYPVPRSTGLTCRPRSGGSEPQPPPPPVGQRSFPPTEEARLLTDLPSLRPCPRHPLVPL